MSQPSNRTPAARGALPVVSCFHLRRDWQGNRELIIFDEATEITQEQWDRWFDANT